MCRDGHVEIGYLEDHGESCPVCVTLAQLAQAHEALREVQRELRNDYNQCGLCGSDDDSMWYASNGLPFHEKWCPVHKVATALASSPAQDQRIADKRAAVTRSGERLDAAVALLEQPSGHEPECPLPAEMTRAPENQRYGVYCTCRENRERLANMLKAVTKLEQPSGEPVDLLAAMKAGLEQSRDDACARCRGMGRYPHAKKGGWVPWTSSTEPESLCEACHGTGKASK